MIHVTLNVTRLMPVRIEKAVQFYTGLAPSVLCDEYLGDGDSDDQKCLVQFLLCG